MDYEINRQITEMSKKPLRDMWAKLMLSEKDEGNETTKKCLDTLKDTEFLFPLKRAVENSEDINQIILDNYMGPPTVIDGNSIQKDPYDDFVQSQPHFFLQTKKPNCLGRAIIIASVYPKDEIKLMEVLKTNEIDTLFNQLKKGLNELKDDEIYTSMNYDGSPVEITGKKAKESLLEGILYAEEPHPTIIEKSGKILDPVEAKFGKPVGIEYDVIDGITANTKNNLCGFVGLFDEQFRMGGKKMKEAESMLDEMTALHPKSAVLKRNKVMFSDIFRQYDILNEIENIFNEYGIDMPHNLYVVKAYLQANLGQKNDARNTLRKLGDKYILSNSLEIIERNVPILGYVKSVI